MKLFQSLFAVVVIAMAVASCKNEQVVKAEKEIGGYTAYIDSISTVAATDAAAKWDEIQAAYDAKKASTEASIQELKNKADFEGKIKAAADKFEAFKQSVAGEKAKLDAVKAVTDFRTTLFEKGDFGDDMSFAWVNKDNILATYDKFVTTVLANKDSYSVEQIDDVKKLYEALDARKNTVEKEGLTSADNLKIAALKVKFAPMLKFERMEKKVEEQVEAKK